MVRWLTVGTVLIRILSSSLCSGLTVSRDSMQNDHRGTLRHDREPKNSTNFMLTDHLLIRGSGQNGGIMGGNWGLWCGLHRWCS
jgi:hypothetical protein